MNDTSQAAVATTAPSPGRLAGFRDFLRAREKLLVWWRGVSPEEHAAIGGYMRDHSELPATLLALHPELRALLRKGGVVPPLILPEEYPRPGLAMVMQALNVKLGWIMLDANPSWFDSGSGVRPTLVDVTPTGITLWQEEPEVAVGDHLELQLVVFPDYPELVTGYARVEKILPDADTAMVAISCQFTLISLEGRESLAQHLIQHQRRKTELNAQGVPATSYGGTGQAEMIKLRRRLREHSGRKEQPAREVMNPAPTTPPTEPLAPWKFDGQPPRELLAPWKFDAQLPREPLLTPPAVPGKPLEPTFPPTTREGSNRRANFRVNLRLPFGWKLVSANEFNRIAANFKLNGNLSELDLTERLRLHRRQVEDQLAGMEKEGLRCSRPAAWLARTIELGCKWANLPGEFNHFLELGQGLARLLAAVNRRLDPVADSFLNLLKVWWELKWKQATFTDQHPQTEQQLTAQALSDATREIKIHLSRLAVVETGFKKYCQPLFDGVEQLDITFLEWPLPDKAHPLPLRELNLSPGGVGFRTGKPEIMMGDYLELQLRITDDQGRPVTVGCMAAVSRIKPLEGQHSQRVGARLILIQRQQQDWLYAHVLRRQRELITRGVG